MTSWMRVSWVDSSLRQCYISHNSNCDELSIIRASCAARCHHQLCKWVTKNRIIRLCQCSSESSMTDWQSQSLMTVTHDSDEAQFGTRFVIYDGGWIAFIYKVVLSLSSNIHEVSITQHYCILSVYTAVHVVFTRIKPQCLNSTYRERCDYFEAAKHYVMYFIG